MLLCVLGLMLLASCSTELPDGWDQAEVNKEDENNPEYQPEMPSYGHYLYFIGATDGWANADQKLETLNDDGVYTGYVYCADPNGWGNEFKFQLIAGNWDYQFNSQNLSSITGDFARGDDNIKAIAGVGVYYVVLNVMDKSLKGKRINNVNLSGEFNGWDPGDNSQKLTWNANDYCFEISDARVNGNGWKFTTNNTWDINLGGTIGKLVADGDNLTVVGTTIKLYPTRKISGNIYCTVK